MPNWCFNKIETTKEVLDFMQSEENDFDYNNLIPMPEELRNTSAPAKTRDEELIKKYGTDNWYNWAIANWGVKWNSSGAHRGSDTTVTLESPWSPPTQIFEELSRKFPDTPIVAYAEEGGMCFAFEATFLDGEEIDVVDYDWIFNTGCPVCEDEYGDLMDYGYEEDPMYILLDCYECGTEYKADENWEKTIIKRGDKK